MGASHAICVCITSISKRKPHSHIHFYPGLASRIDCLINGRPMDDSQWMDRLGSYTIDIIHCITLHIALIVYILAPDRDALLYPWQSEPSNRHNRIAIIDIQFRHSYFPAGHTSTGNNIKSCLVYILYVLLIVLRPSSICFFLV